MKSLFLVVLVALGVSSAWAQNTRTDRSRRITHPSHRETRPTIRHSELRERYSRPVERSYSRRNYRGGYSRSYSSRYGRFSGSYSRYNRYYIPPTGIKFHLELVPEREREMVKRGVVLVDGAEIGIVNRYDGFWNGAASSGLGEHEIMVELEDGRIFQTQVVINPGQVLHIYLRFPPMESKK